MENMKKIKNMKAKSPSNGPFPTLPCPPRSKNLISQKKSREFNNGNFSTIFCGFWRLLGRLEKEKTEKMKKKKSETKEEGKQGKTNKKSKTEKMKKMKK